MAHMREHAAPKSITPGNVPRATRQNDIQGSRQIVKARAAFFAPGGRCYLKVLNLLKHRRLRNQVCHHLARQILQPQQATLQRAQQPASEAVVSVQACPRSADAHDTAHLDVGVRCQDVGKVRADEAAH